MAPAPSADPQTPRTRRVRLFGLHDSSEAYLIRDFLARSVVEFDWVEIHSDADALRELGTALANARLPIVEMPDNAQLFAPTVREVAARLGWVSQPRFAEYDLSIYGAGPAGLSAAVYAGSEGLCRGQHVFLVGGGNSAGQAAMNFAGHAEKVTMVVRGDSLAASLSHYLIERVKETPTIEVLYHTEVSALEGDDSLRRIQLTNVKSGVSSWLESERLFICIGGAPNTEWAKETAIVRDPSGYLITGPDLFHEGRPPACWTPERQPFFLETSVPGSFAAGDVRHNSVKRVASAVGEGAMAVTFVHRYLEQSR